MKVFDYNSQSFHEKLWRDVQVGDLLKIMKDEQFATDILFIKCSSKNGIGFVDTMNLDGETNLKEKLVTKETQDIEEHKIYSMDGVIDCDPPNEFLEFFEANVSTQDINAGKPFIARYLNFF